LARACAREDIDWRTSEAMRDQFFTLVDRIVDAKMAGVQSIRPLLKTFVVPAKDRALSLQLAKAWGRVADNAGAYSEASLAVASTVEAFERVNELATPYNTDISFIEQIAYALAGVIQAKLRNKSDPESALSYVDQLAKLNDENPSNKAIALCAAGAWGCVVKYFSELPYGAGADQAYSAYKRFEKLVTQPNLTTLSRAQQLHFRCLAALSTCYGNIPRGTNLDIATDFANAFENKLNSFRNDNGFDEFIDNSIHIARASMWCCLADNISAWTERNDAANAAASQCIEAIAQLGPSMEASYFSACAWSVSTTCSAGNRKVLHANLALEAAKEMQRSARRVSNDFPEPIITADAWSRVAQALSTLPGGCRADSTVEAAEEVDRIGVTFSTDMTIQRLRVLALRSVAFAYNQIPRGEGAEQSQRAANRVNEIAGSFLSDGHIQLSSAVAARYACFAWAQVPKGRGATQATMEAERLEAIATPFEHDPEWATKFAYECAHAWRDVTHARRNMSDLAGARRAGARVKSLVERFPTANNIAAEWTIVSGILSGEA